MILGIDVGGTKTLVALINKKGKVVQQIRFETPKNYQEFISKLEINVAKLTTRPEVCILGLPGRINRKLGVGLSFGNLPWQDVPIRADLASFIKCPIHIENDANLAGLSEANVVLNKYRKVVYITISTGIGIGVVIDGKLDKNTLDAEVGHMMLEHMGKLQRWEDFASGKAIVARTGKRASEITESQEWYKIAHDIALGLINVIASYTPECIIIGGGVGSHLEKFHAQLVGELRMLEDDMLVVPPILKAKHAEEAVINGCYAYATQL